MVLLEVFDSDELGNIVKDTQYIIQVVILLCVKIVLFHY